MICSTRILALPSRWRAVISSQVNMTDAAFHTHQLNCPEYVVEVKRTFTFPGLLNFTATDAAAPGTSVVTPGTVMYGLPRYIPVAFASVTPGGNWLRTTWMGP